ncbi:hypothetical protein HYS94_00760 [Candidatus Daviesbacteria bacterium]|nr:hypothetical protein [Candidatus Daviesbacteria bacterium]
MKELPPIIVYPRHPSLEALYRENPQPSWDKILDLLISIFPQVENGQLQYLIEGGVAVHLLIPTRQIPEDVDLVLRSEDSETEKKFAGTPSKSAKRWLESRRIPGSEPNIRILFSHSTPVQFNGRPVYILDALALTFSKSVDLHSTPLHIAPPRPKDLKDLRLLGISQAQIEEFLAEFTI